MLYVTRATIDLDALRHNIEAVRTLAGDAKILATVKANAYGHGAVPVAQFYEAHGLADWLGVETVPEALQLTDAGVELPILKLSLTFPDELVPLIANDVAVTVADETAIDQADDAAAVVGVKASVHLKVDTGMGRIGCPESRAAGLARRILACRHLDLQGVFTHLPISDGPDDGFTEAELARFLAVVDGIQADRAAAGLAPVPLIHASNSGAVLGHSLAGLTMVRPGIMLYGYYPGASRDPGAASDPGAARDPEAPSDPGATRDPGASSGAPELRPAMTLTSAVSAVKRVAAGDTIGYGRTWAAPCDTWIATVPVGYADGFSRLNSNTGAMLIGGRRCPVAGRVCMDSTMLDAGPGDQAPVSVGDKVTWLGTDGEQRITADDLARIMGTISYEVLCLIGARVPRDYVGG